MVFCCIFSGNDMSGVEFLFKLCDKLGEVYKFNIIILNLNIIEIWV